MLKGLGDMGKLMKQAQEMQAKMAEATEIGRASCRERV